MSRDESVRRFGENFLRHLHYKRIFRQEWRRDELGKQYDVFQRASNMPFTFSAVLFKLSSIKPQLLRVVRGQLVIFHKRAMTQSWSPQVTQQVHRKRDESVFPIGKGSVNRRRRSQYQRGVPGSIKLSSDTLPTEHRPFAPLSTRLDRRTSRNGGTVATSSKLVSPISATEPRALASLSNRLDRQMPRNGGIVGTSPKLVSPILATVYRALNSTPKMKVPILTPTRSDRKNSQYHVTSPVRPASSLAIRDSPCPPVRVSTVDSERTASVSAGKSTTGEDKTTKKRDTASEAIKRNKKVGRGIISGLRPTFLQGGQNEICLGLDEYNVPNEVRCLQKFSPVGHRLCHENYESKFHHLLYLEELHYQKDIKVYAMQSAMLQRLKKKQGYLLHLTVPGLAEKRPSLLVGDRVFAIKLDSNGEKYGVKYEGFVHNVEQLQVGLGFNQALLNVFQAKMKFSISFTFNRKPLRLMHRAIDLIRNYPGKREMLFPSEPPKVFVPKSSLTMYNRKIKQNRQQKTAVENIVLGVTSPIYILFGPPGTGKTVTMVESILQMLDIFPSYNILVCALSNFACDLLAERLLKNVDKAKMIRLYAASRNWKDIPRKLKEGGTTNYKGGEFYLPMMEDLKKYRVIVCTFVTAGRLASLMFPRDHFQRIFVDESGQAFEPECLIAIAGVLANDGKVVLAGDPKQLGPIVRSPISMRNGLQLSLLERLMTTCSIYQKDPKSGKYNPQCVTKLAENYRSHECILAISNKKFYDGELQVCANKMVTEIFCGWEELPNKKFPIIFHGVEGNQTKEKSSPSYFNPEEVKIVSDYVKTLTGIRGMRKMHPTDIGIVTPYRKQVEKIRSAIKTPEIDVGSVEVFQGQERLVIIISTVRSSQENLTDDAIYHLGFLCDPKRFNVALTRAKSLVIIVGNPRLLCLDKYWKSLLKYCLENGGYRGVKFSPKDFHGAKEMEEITDLFSKMKVPSPNEDEHLDEDQPSPFWRREH